MAEAAVKEGDFRLLIRLLNSLEILTNHYLLRIVLIYKLNPKIQTKWMKNLQKKSNSTVGRL